MRFIILLKTRPSAAASVANLQVMVGGLMELQLISKCLRLTPMEKMAALEGGVCNYLLHYIYIVPSLMVQDRLYPVETSLQTLHPPGFTHKSLETFLSRAAALTATHPMSAC